LPRSGEIRIDGSVMLFTVVISLTTGVLFGIAPAFQSSRIDLVESLKEGARHAH
jgi:ABC-type antimicrobial peptide transport system permease subunit